jgi:exosortase
LILAFCIPTVLLFWPMVKIAVDLAMHDDRYLQIILAPPLCAFLIFRYREEIFAQARFSPRAGIPMLSVAVLLELVLAYRPSEGGITSLILPLAALVFTWLAAFFLCYGARSFRAAIYPLSCLLLMIPLPPSWMDGIVAALQKGSADVSFQLLRWSGVPVLRSGMVFSLPGLDFEIASECSGIHSSLALLIVAILAGYVYLRSGWGRAALILLTVPIAVLKNAVRIVVISTLGAYVNRTFAEGPFHHQYGGLLFTVVGVTLFVVVLAALQMTEKRLSSHMAF